MVTLIDFYADWCGPCVAMKPILEDVMKGYVNKVVVETVNVDTDQQKASQYGIMSIPTLVLLKDDNEVDRKVGLQQAEQLKSWLDSHTAA